MKKWLQSILQRVFGFDNYLVLFSLFKIYTLKWDRKDKEGDFNYFLELLSPNDILLDVGANIGIMTALMARKSLNGRVFAFEPIPENVKTIERIVRLLKLKNVEMVPYALGIGEKEIEMTMPILKGVKMQGLSHVNHETIDGYDSEAVPYKVRQTSLDTYPPLQKVAVSAIKMDVENYEQFVLKGGLNLLKTHKPIIYCELWDNDNRKNCFELLTELGYQIKVLEKKQLVDFVPNFHTHHNFFFMPNPAYESVF